MPDHHLRTPVAIIGAGPAGLMLSHLLAIEGIDSIVLELKSRDYVEKRVRAGVLEHGTVETLRAAGLAGRLDREGLVHRGLEILFEGHAHRIDLAGLTGGRTITIYGQQEVVKDLIEARLASGAPLHFEVGDVVIHGADFDAPHLSCTLDGEAVRIDCDVVAGCDGFHGISRDAIPAFALRIYQRDYPFAWVGALVQAPPSSEELIYAHHDRGFALHSMRSTEITRLYLQCDSDDQIDDWPDERIWDELRHRLARPGWRLAMGPILEKSITGMRSFVAEPMSHRRIFLVGDAAHIVPPTGAKGLNLAIGDARVLAAALGAYFRTGSTELLDQYSATRLESVWRAQDFSYQMTSMLHTFPGESAGFDRRRQLARLRQLTTSVAAATALAEGYVGGAQ